MGVEGRCQWAGGYDWRATEARLNQIPQFTTTIDGLDIHFLHIRSPHPGAVLLSSRESEVASLIAVAMSNRQIAERLVLSERTVEAHVRSILAKLGYSTRTEIATWALRGASSHGTSRSPANHQP